MPEYTTKQKITRKDVILKFIQQVGEKSLVEFRGGYTKTIPHGNWTEEIYVPDSRKEYIQSVEFLSDILFPDFNKKKDTKTLDFYKKVIEKIKSLLKEYEEGKMEQEDFIIKKCRLTRTLFQEIMLGLERIKFWKKEIKGG